ncbi:MAG: MFS transporter [Bacteroidota bacterium]
MQKTMPWGLILLLMLAYALSFADRYLLNLLVVPIQENYGFSDTQMGYLLGPAFGLFYALVGLPLGYLADRIHRPKLIALGMALWSLMTLLTGFAQRYASFFLTRMGVGIGEASLSPSDYSLLAERVSTKRLSTAIAFYSMGIYLGAGLAYGLGGEILSRFAEAEPWQWGSVSIPVWQSLFIGFAIPGFILSIWILFAIREYRTKLSKSLSIRHLLQKEKWLRLGAPFYWLCAAFACFYVAIYAGGAWLPSFLMRVHQLPPNTTGWITSLGLMILPGLGLLGGGLLADSMSQANPILGKLKFCILAMLLFLPASIVFGVLPDLASTLWALLPYGLLLSATVSVGAALVQQMVPPSERAFASAVLIFAQNCLGLSLGPTAVGWLTDHTFSGAQSLGYALALVGGLSVLLASLSLAFLYRRLRAAPAQIAPS